MPWSCHILYVHRCAEDNNLQLRRTIYSPWEYFSCRLWYIIQGHISKRIYRGVTHTAVGLPGASAYPNCDISSPLHWFVWLGYRAYAELSPLLPFITCKVIVWIFKSRAARDGGGSVVRRDMHTVSTDCWNCFTMDCQAVTNMGTYIGRLCDN